MSDEERELEARIMAEIAAQAEAELGYPLPADAFATGSTIRPGDDPYAVMGIARAKGRGFERDAYLGGQREGQTT